MTSNDPLIKPVLAECCCWKKSDIHISLGFGRHSLSKEHSPHRRLGLGNQKIAGNGRPLTDTIALLAFLGVRERDKYVEQYEKGRGYAAKSH